MDWHVFLEAYNWCLMYCHGYTRIWAKPGDQEGGMKYRKVYDEENQNWIDYMEDEKDRYVWVDKRNCFMLPKGK